MVIQPQKSYVQTPSKLRMLWNIAMRLIGNYEDFDRRLTDLEKKFNDFSSKLTSTVDRIKNV